VSNSLVGLVVSVMSLTGGKPNEPVGNSLDLSRHVLIDLSCFRPGFQPEKVASRLQTQTNLSKTWSKTRVSSRFSTR